MGGSDDECSGKTPMGCKWVRLRSEDKEILHKYYLTVITITIRTSIQLTTRCVGAKGKATCGDSQANLNGL